MLNGLYVYLNNLAASQTESLYGADWVPENYEPVTLHTSVALLREALFGRDPQASQYWICRARQIIRRCSLQDYVPLQAREGGYPLQTVADAIRHYMRPTQLPQLGQFESFGRYVADAYNVLEFDLVRESDEVKAYRNGQLVSSAAVVNGTAKLQLIPATEAGVSVPVESVPCRMAWAATPHNRIEQHMESLLPVALPLVRAVTTLPSVFAEEQRESLGRQADMAVQTQIGFGAMALLVAGHTAAVAGGSTL